jgi:hypothetical protein
MVDYEHRPLTKAERSVAIYCDLVAHGYHDICVEYPNDISCREYIEIHKDDPEIIGIWRRVEEADGKLRAFLIPTVRCIHGEYPRACFWYWGCPRNSPDLERELREAGDFG